MEIILIIVMITYGYNNRLILYKSYYTYMYIWKTNEHELNTYRGSMGSSPELPPTVCTDNRRVCADRRGRLGTDGRDSRRVSKELQRRSTKTHKPQTQHLHNFAGWVGGQETWDPVATRLKGKHKCSLEPKWHEWMKYMLISACRLFPLPSALGSWWQLDCLNASNVHVWVQMLQSDVIDSAPLADIRPLH